MEKQGKWKAASEVQNKYLTVGVVSNLGEDFRSFCSFSGPCDTMYKHLLHWDKQTKKDRTKHGVFVFLGSSLAG